MDANRPTAAAAGLGPVGTPGARSSGPSLEGRTPEPSRRGRASLLVVDDEPEVLHSVQDLLRLDYRVITRSSGAAALDVLRSGEDIQVIMSDQRMPGLTGVEVLREAEAIRPDATRLLFTAYADIRAVIDAINQGHVFRYLAKPWDPNELAAAVRQAVEHHDLIVEKNRLLGELRAANTKLTEADRLKGAFLEVASHELNTPVSVILGLIELWRMTAGHGTPPDPQWLDRLGGQARRLARTVERMLKLVRSGDFGRPLERQSVEIAPLLHRAIDDLRPYLELRRQAVNVEVDAGMAPIAVDPDKIADALTNLLANAVKFTPDGGTIRVEVAAEPGPPEQVRVSVSDEGPGVPAADQQYLFEPFFTGFDTLRHSSGDYQFGKRGLGLGLWLVKTFVEMHGGRVEVASSRGRGSTFSFVLPREHAPASGSDAASPPAQDC